MSWQRVGGRGWGASGADAGGDQGHGASRARAQTRGGGGSHREARAEAGGRNGVVVDKLGTPSGIPGVTEVVERHVRGAGGGAGLEA